MATLRERFQNWKSRKWHQKAGDILFWTLILLMLIPGPRKQIATGVNKVFLHLRRPSISADTHAYRLSDAEYNWNIRDASGRPVQPGELKGEVIFLNFWGTYCPPCIAEMPEIRDIYADYGDRVRFLLVSQESPEKVTRFLVSRDYHLPAYFGGMNMPEALSYRSVPTTFIIARDGRIVSRKVGAADWNSRATRRVFDTLLEEEAP